MSSRVFTHINESFACEYCGKQVEPLVAGGCRNHCPFCLSSKHVDMNPGDRANDCHGRLMAVGYEHHPKKGLMLIFKCQKCHFTGRNKSATDDPNQPDDYDLILSLTPKA